MNLSDNLQDYLSQSGSSKFQQASNSNGLLGFWNGKQSSTEISLADDDADTSNLLHQSSQQDGNRLNNRSGWFRSFNLPFTTQSADSNQAPTRIQKLCSIFPTLGYYQRMSGFGMCLFLGGILIFLAIMNVPFLVLRPRKFATLFTLGSLFVICSIGCLVGPSTYCSYVFSTKNLKSTTFYLFSLIATLYSSMVLQSALLTIPFVIIQVVGLMYLVISYIPGGQAGLSMMSSLITPSFLKKSVSTSLPI